jgi:hypothetical protein
MSNGHPHQSAYTPPIPALEITLQDPDGNLSVGPLEAVLDTGADISLVPVTLLEQLAAPEQDEVRLRSHWGDYTIFTTYLISIQLGSEILPGIEVVGDLSSQREVLLGRDVLNKLLLLIDGPQQRTDLLSHRPRRLT